MTTRNDRPNALNAPTAPASSPPIVFISAAEPSADRIGADLIKTVNRSGKEVRFVGVAGPHMRQAGCHCLFDMTRHSAMLLAALRNVGRGFRVLNASEQFLREHQVAAALLIDSPMLHLPLAGRARAAGVPVLYYVAPQLWAWGAHRIYKLRHWVDKLACILPFEEEYFQNQGVEAQYVGHPLAQHLHDHPIDFQLVAKIRGNEAPTRESNSNVPVARRFDGGESPFVALLPGSRLHVVESVFPGQLEIAQAIASRFPGARFGVSIAGPHVENVIRDSLRTAGVDIAAFGDHLPELICAADLVLVASGSTSLEVAFHARPMIVMYRSSPFFYRAVGQWMIRTQWFALPNILAGQAIVPEFVPYFGSTQPIAQCAVDLLADASARERICLDLQRIVAPLRRPNASESVAAMLLQMIR